MCNPMKASCILPPLGALFMLTMLSNCKKSENEPSLEDQAKKVWVANQVTENAILVYDRSGGAKIRDYGSFKLDLSAPPTVTLTEVEGSAMRGKYQIVDRDKLVLSDLNPIPTGTTGSITYNLTLTDGSMDLQQTANNSKTGNTRNTYRLKPL